MSIDETAETMFKMHKPNVYTLISIYREIRDIFDTIKNKDTEVNSNYNWTGQHTDIAFVGDKGSINISEINSISDLELRQNVYQSYNSAVKDGYLKYNKSTQNFSLTDKGNQHINSDGFKIQFEKDQSQIIAQNKAQIQLSGNPSDLNAFRYTNSIDLNHLLYDDPVKFKRIQTYFEVCEKYNFVNIKDGIVTATDKCKEYLSQNPEENFNISMISPDFVNECAKNFNNTTKQAINNEAAKKISLEMAKKKAVQKAVQKSIKAVNTGGTGAAVTAIIKLTASGTKKIIKQKSTSAIRNH